MMARNLGEKAAGGAATHPVNPLPNPGVWLARDPETA